MKDKTNLITKTLLGILIVSLLGFGIYLLNLDIKAKKAIIELNEKGK